MFHFPAVAYVAGVGATVGAVMAADPSLPLGGVVALAVLAPVAPVLVGYMLTHRKLVAQDLKVQEIHVLVNSQLSTTLAALQDALLEGIRLKEKVGETLTPIEREVAALPEGETLTPALVVAATTAAGLAENDSPPPAT